MIAVMDPVHDVLKTEAAEINNYVRLGIQVTLAFFAFFITVTFTALAFNFKEAFAANQGSLLIVEALLALQSVLSIVGILLVRADVVRAGKRIGEIQTAIAEGKFLHPGSPVPRSFERSLRLLAISMTCFLIIVGVFMATGASPAAKAPPASPPSAPPASTTR